MASNLSPADRAELNRLWAELTNALRVIEHLLGDDDPTGLTYSRDDEVPAAPVPPDVDGLSITGRPRRPNSSPTGYAPDTRREAHSSGPGPVGVKRGGVAVGAVASPTLRGGLR